LDERILKETEVLLSVPLCSIAPLKALLEAEEGLFFMRVNEEDKRVRLLIPSELKSRAFKFLNAVKQTIPFEILSRKELSP